MSIRLILAHISQKIFTLPSFCCAYFDGCSAVTARADSKSDKWLSPAASAAKKNPITSTPESIGAGQKIYSKTCAMCHGKTGDADGPAVIELNIHPAKLSDPHLATESDGSLFWKITTGKKPMPAYGKRLSETDRWNLVNYVRTLPKH